MAKFDVIRYGTDSSGRPIYMTRYMKAWLEAVLSDHRVKPFADRVTIVQGAFMVKAGGGATASAGYHDGGGCLDFRTWNLTTAELNAFIIVCRLKGGAAWRRDSSYLHGGMDPHCHVTLGGDGKMSSGAKASWSSYLNSGDGLAGGRSDYEWRPSPIRHFKYKQAPKKPKVNLTHLLNAYYRPGGRTYNAWGQKACRQWTHRLREDGTAVKGYKWKKGWFGNNLKAATKRSNHKHGVTEFTGPNGDRPTWELAKRLGFEPYKKGKVNRPKKRVKAFTKRDSDSSR